MFAGQTAVSQASSAQSSGITSPRSRQVAHRLSGSSAVDWRMFTLPESSLFVSVFGSQPLQLVPVLYPTDTALSKKPAGSPEGPTSPSRSHIKNSELPAKGTPRLSWV